MTLATARSILYGAPSDDWTAEEVEEAEEIVAQQEQPTEFNVYILEKE